MAGSCGTGQLGGSVFDTFATAITVRIRDPSGSAMATGSQVLVLSSFIAEQPYRPYSCLCPSARGFPNLPQRPLQTHRVGDTKTVAGPPVAAASTLGHTQPGDWASGSRLALAAGRGLTRRAAAPGCLALTPGAGEL